MKALENIKKFFAKHFGVHSKTPVLKCQKQKFLAKKASAIAKLEKMRFEEIAQLKLNDDIIAFNNMISKIIAKVEVATTQEEVVQVLQSYAAKVKDDSQKITTYYHDLLTNIAYSNVLDLPITKDIAEKSLNDALEKLRNNNYRGFKNIAKAMNDEITSKILIYDKIKTYFIYFQNFFVHQYGTELVAKLDSMTAIDFNFLTEHQEIKLVDFELFWQLKNIEASYNATNLLSTFATLEDLFIKFNNQDYKENINQKQDEIFSLYYNIFNKYQAYREQNKDNKMKMEFASSTIKHIKEIITAMLAGKIPYEKISYLTDITFSDYELDMLILSEFYGFNVHNPMNIFIKRNTNKEKRLDNTSFYLFKSKDGEDICYQKSFNGWNKFNVSKEKLSEYIPLDIALRESRYMGSKISCILLADAFCLYEFIGLYFVVLPNGEIKLVDSGMMVKQMTQVEDIKQISVFDFIAKLSNDMKTTLAEYLINREQRELAQIKLNI